MHENYLFPTVTLLVLVFGQSKFLKIFACILSVTALANMALHDVIFRPQFWFLNTTVIHLAILNSGIHTLVFIVWTFLLIIGFIKAQPDGSAGMRSTSLHTSS